VIGPANLTRVAKQVGTVGVLYGGSIVALLIGELLLARGTSQADFGTYSLVRSAIPLISALGLLGFDQALTRECAAASLPVRFDKRQVLLSGRSCILALGVGAYLCGSMGVPWQAGLGLVLAATCVTVSNLVSGVMRATGHPNLAALGQQGYRLATGCTFIALWGNVPGNSSVWVLFVATCMVSIVCISWSLRLSVTWSMTPPTQRVLTRLGYGYALAMLSLAATDWIDQAIVGEIGGLREVGRYSQAKLIAVYPLLSLGSILGFLALPAIASQREFLTLAKLRSWGQWASFAVAALLLVAIPITLFSSSALLHDPLAHGPIVILTCAGAVRLLYVLPSAVLGAVAGPRTLATFGSIALAGTFLQVGTTIVLSDLGISLAAALGLLAAALLRVISSALLCWSTVRIAANGN